MVTRRLGTTALASGLLWALSCTVGPDSSFTDLQPLVFPAEGQLGPGENEGSTIAIVIDSNRIDGFDIGEKYDLDLNKVQVGLRKGTVTGCVGKRGVFSLQAPPSSYLHKTRPGAYFTFLIVDLPGSDGSSGCGFDPGLPYPYTATLEVWIDGALAFAPRVRITGENGAPSELLDPDLDPEWQDAGPYAGIWMLDAQTQPLLRFRPKRAAGTFQPGQPAIGAMKFRYVTNDGCLTALRAYPASDAANATILVSPPYEWPPEGGNLDAYDVVLIDPKGIDLEYLQDLPGLDTTDETLAGEGPILDLAPDFDPGLNWEDPEVWAACFQQGGHPDYNIEDLQVYDLDGNELFEVGSVQVDTTEVPSQSAHLRVYLPGWGT
jgi:hypothetical protein